MADGEKSKGRERIEGDGRKIDSKEKGIEKE